MESNNQNSEFENYVKTNWQNFQFEKDFHNVTLACADKQIQTHKIVLSCSSPILAEILKEKVNENPLIYIPGVKYTDLQNLIDFMYKGEVNVAHNDLNNFLSLAKDLKVKGLSENIENDIIPTQNIGYNKGQSSPKRKHLIEKVKNKNKNIIQMLEQIPVDIMQDEVIVTQGDLNNFAQNNLEDKNVKVKRLSENMGNDLIKKATNVNMIQTMEENQIDIIEDELNVMEGGPDESIKTYQYSDESSLAIDYAVRSILPREGISEDKAIHNNVLPKEKQMPAFIKTTENVSLKHKQANNLSHSEGLGTSERSKIDRNPKDVQFFCDKCFYKTPNIDHLQEHIKSNQHNSPEETTNTSSISNFYCDICNKPYPYSTPDGVRRHKKAIHGGVSYPCDQCNMKPFSGLQSLKIHTERVHGGTINKSQFPVKSTQKSTRKSSIFSFVSQFKCDQCPYETKNMDRLQAHIKLTQHNFSITQQNFTLKPTEEIANISAKSKFYCNKCNKQYSRADSLNRHKEVEHEGVRYPCDQCDTNPFVEMRNLKIHKEKVHEGIKYPCVQCSGHPYFSELRKLKEHIKQVHPAYKLQKNQC